MDRNQNQRSVSPNSLTQEATSQAKGQKSDLPDSVNSSSTSWQSHLRGKAAKLAQGDAQVANQTPLPNTEMPPALKSLIDFLNLQPGQALKVPANRLPEVETFLLQAGISADQVKNLLNSANFQEQGLTAQTVQSAWRNTVKNSLQQALTAGDPQISGTLGQTSVQKAAQLVSLQNLTNQSDYQQMWQNLTLPAKALPELRVELQKLGVPPEALVDLNEQKFPQGIPLSQAWQYLQQASKSSATNAPSSGTSDAAKGNMAQNSPLLLPGGKDLANWRQLLVKAGMEPELAQTLTSSTSPANQEELRTGLMQMAPQSTPSQEQEVPQPLYLPGNLRVRQVPLLQQANLGQGQGGGNGNSTPNFGFSSKPQETNIPATANVTENLNNFLALLSGNSLLKTDQAASLEVSGTQASSVNSYLTPEAKEALWSQVQSGVLGNLRPGENQITLTLNPPDLGKLQLTLNLKGEQVEVTAITTHPAVAEAATTGVQQLAQALNQQGLILTQFNFHHQDPAPQGQTQLAFSQNQGDQQQAGRKEPDKWEKPATPRQSRWAGGIDCFA